MTTQNLLDDLSAQGITLWVEGGQLRYKAPPKAMTDALKARVLSCKSALLSHLTPTTHTSENTPVRATGNDDPFAPFPLTPLQRAYLAGQTDAFVMGGTNAISYLEFERSALDPGAAERALNRLIDRHDALRLKIHDDKAQAVLEKVPYYRIPVTDLKGLSPEEQERLRTDLRDKLCNHPFKAGEWPLFAFHWSLDETGFRLHSVINLIALDAWSCQLFFREWFSLIDGEQDAPPLQLTFRDCLLKGTPEKAVTERAWGYWNETLAALPSGPTLPSALHVSENNAPGGFERLEGRLSPEDWAAFKSICRTFAVTPSCALATVFANVLSCWSEQEDLSLILTLFNRTIGHKDINRVLGEFTNTTLLGFSRMERPLVDQIQGTGQTLLNHIEHSAVAGVDVLRKFSLQRGDMTGALMPVVFTCLLVGNEEDLFEKYGWKGGSGISRTPQVSLDHQVYEKNRALVFNWDIALHSLNGEAIACAFKHYEDTLTRLSRQADLWTQTPSRALPQAQAILRPPFGAGSSRVLDSYGADRPDHVCGRLYVSGQDDPASGKKMGSTEKGKGDAIPTATDGWRETGNLACFRPNGCVDLLGRKDQQLEINGRRFDLGKIVRTLEANEHVRRAVVKTEAHGADIALVAHVECLDKQTTNENELRGHCSRTLPAHMIPVRIATYETLPLGTDGHPDSSVLPDLMTQSAPKSDTPVHPGTLQERIRDLLEDCFDIGLEDAGESFFNLGVTSLDLVKAHTRLKETLKVDFHVADMFFNPSIKALETHLQNLLRT